MFVEQLKRWKWKWYEYNFVLITYFLYILWKLQILNGLLGTVNHCRKVPNREFFYWLTIIFNRYLYKNYIEILYKSTCLYINFKLITSNYFKSWSRKNSISWSRSCMCWVALKEWCQREVEKLLNLSGRL